MFAAPPDQSLEWNEAGVEGMARVLRRFWREVTAHAAGGAAPKVDASALNAAQKTLRRQVHETIQKVSDDIGRRYAFNTAIAALMELLNAVSKFDDASEQGRAVRHEALEAMVLLLNPVTPHISHALWQTLGHAIGPGPLDDQAWPKADTGALAKDAVTLAVQVNGKLRGTIDVPVSASREEVERIALAEQKVADFIGGATPKKVIVVPGKIVNVVI
jgi:leucyl-tRNA synthetase